MYDIVCKVAVLGIVCVAVCFWASVGLCRAAAKGIKACRKAEG